MIMTQFTQGFRLYQPPGAFGAEWVCADESCAAPMTVTADEGPGPGSDTGAQMTHAEGCRYSAGATGQQ
jgi:hypothetical protein